MKLRGEIIFKDTVNDKINSEDDKIFKVDDKEMTNTDLENWAIMLNSPWSQDLLEYVIELNCIDAFTEISDKEPKWRCTFSTLGYDALYASCIGYGNTEEEALADCKKLLKYIQKTYNPEDIAI